MGAKWTKAEIKSMCGHIDTFWLTNRPLSDSMHDLEVARAGLAAVLSDPHKRREIVLAGIRQFRAMNAERYKSYCETIGNQLVRFTAYGQPDELIERFTRFAREEDAANRKGEALLHRVLDEGLPPEVTTYNPLESR